MNKPRRKKYLLFLMGNFDKIESILEEITNIVNLVMDGPHLRYIHHDNLIICHFESRALLEEMNEFFNDSLPDDFESYFLIRKPNKIGTRLDDDLSKHLFNLKENKRTPKGKPSHEIPRIKEMIEGFATELKKTFMEKTKKTNFDLDEVLEKISEYGIDSLSPEEKYFLKNIPK